MSFIFFGVITLSPSTMSEEPYCCPFCARSCIKTPTQWECGTCRFHIPGFARCQNTKETKEHKDFNLPLPDSKIPMKVTWEEATIAPEDMVPIDGQVVIHKFLAPLEDTPKNTCIIHSIVKNLQDDLNANEDKTGWGFFRKICLVTECLTPQCHFTKVDTFLKSIYHFTEAFGIYHGALERKVSLDDLKSKLNAFQF